MCHIAPAIRRPSIRERGLRVTHWTGAQLVSWWIDAQAPDLIRSLADDYTRERCQAHELWYVRCIPCHAQRSVGHYYYLEYDVPPGRLFGPYVYPVTLEEIGV